MPRAQQYASHCNGVYASEVQKFYSTHPNPGPPPTARIAIITCMDARLDVFKMFNLELGEAHVIRTGGGRVMDVVRSLVASEHILNTEEVMVVHHTDCGFTKVPNEDAARERVAQSLGGLSVEWCTFMPIKDCDYTRSVRDDVAFLRASPYVKKSAVVTGWIFDTLKGTIAEVDC